MTLVLRMKTPGWLDVLVGKRACSANASSIPGTHLKTTFLEFIIIFPKYGKLLVCLLWVTQHYILYKTELYSLTDSTTVLRCWDKQLYIFSVGTSMNSTAECSLLGKCLSFLNNNKRHSCIKHYVHACHPSYSQKLKHSQV